MRLGDVLGGPRIESARKLAMVRLEERQLEVGATVGGGIDEAILPVDSR
jgi:hypothetical protein